MTASPAPRILTVAAGFYFYLRVVAAMYWQEPQDDRPITFSFLTRCTVAALTLARRLASAYEMQAPMMPAPTTATFIRAACPTPRGLP